MYQISFYVPAEYTEQVKQALFSAGAGKIGNYDCCSWQADGTGQFRPLEKSQPFIGKHGVTEKVVESKVEMVCDAGHIKAAISALKASHPYEEPAYAVIKLEIF